MKEPKPNRRLQKAPLESFDPRLMDVLIQGTRNRVTLPFLGPEGKAKGHNFHRRLHTLRARMRDAEHEHAQLVTKTLVRILWGAKAFREKVTEGFSGDWVHDPHGTLGAFVVLTPRDEEFSEALDRMKVEPSTSPLALSAEVPPAGAYTPNERAELEALLDEVKPQEDNNE